MACDKCLKFSFTNLCKNKIKEETLTEQLKSLQKDIDGIKGMERNIEKELNETLSYSKVLKQNIEEIKVKNLNGDAKVNDQELEKVGDIIRDKINEDMQIKVKNEAIERSLIIQGIAEDSIKNYDKRITNEMQKLEHLITNGMKISMPKIEKLQRIEKFNEKMDKETEQSELSLLINLTEIRFSETSQTLDKLMINTKIVISRRI